MTDRIEPSSKKKKIREVFRALLDELPVEQIESRSCSMAILLRGCPEYVRSQTIFVFLSIKGEINTTDLIEQAWSDGKRILVPKVNWQRRVLQAVEIQSLDRGLATGRFGIREPVSRIPVAVSEIDLAIVPGLAFDREGRRLGRGGGFYDRFIGEAGFRGTVCAISLDEQFIDSVPIEAHDRTIDMLVTDTRVLRFAAVTDFGKN